MKLAEIYNRATILITLAILVIAGGIYFIAISYISNTQLDRNLTEEIQEIEEYAKRRQRLPDPIAYDEEQANFYNIGRQTVPRRFTDTTFTDLKNKEIEPGRAVIGTIAVGTTNYKVVITESKESTEYLIQIIGVITLALTVLLIAALFLINRYMLNSVWKPFYMVLNRMKSFTLTGSIEPLNHPIQVEEFRELRDVMDTMAGRVIRDYQVLKSFTENASHEMMTPVAVITSKLDMLIQDESLKESQYEQLHELYVESSRLSKLNQSLLLLTKIDNRQITDLTTIDLKEAIEVKIRQFQEILRAKDLDLHYHLEDKKIYGSVYLTDILLNNLFSNAIRHNVRNGRIRITLRDELLRFENTGLPEPLDSEKIFERFSKGKTSEGTGLGLTIAKNICTVCSLELSYEYQDPYHRFSIRFQR